MRALLPFLSSAFPPRSFPIAHYSICTFPTIGLPSSLFSFPPALWVNPWKEEAFLSLIPFPLQLHSVFQVGHFIHFLKWVTSALLNICRLHANERLGCTILRVLAISTYRYPIHCEDIMSTFLHDNLRAGSIKLKFCNTCRRPTKKYGLHCRLYSRDSSEIWEFLLKISHRLFSSFTFC